MSSLKGKFSTSRGEKNHMGLQRKANKPDCGAQPVEQLLFCPCGKFPDSSHQPTPPKNHFTFEERSLHQGQNVP